MLAMLLVAGKIALLWSIVDTSSSVALISVFEGSEFLSASVNSGYNAVPAQKPVNVAMYAAGGAVAGAVVGAGAMHLTWDRRL